MHINKKKNENKKKINKRGPNLWRFPQILHEEITTDL